MNEKSLLDALARELFLSFDSYKWEDVKKLSPDGRLPIIFLESLASLAVRAHKKEMRKFFEDFSEILFEFEDTEMPVEWCVNKEKFDKLKSRFGGKEK